jgi:hypothetical protein
MKMIPDIPIIAVPEDLLQENSHHTVVARTPVYGYQRGAVLSCDFSVLELRQGGIANHTTCFNLHGKFQQLDDQSKTLLGISKVQAFKQVSL